MFSAPQFNALSNVLIAAGQVFFASMFIGPLVSGSINWPVIIAGAGLSFFCWSFSVALIKESL